MSTVQGRRGPFAMLFVLLLPLACAHTAEEAGLKASGGATEAERYTRELERLDRGEPADLNGDGRPDTFQQTLPDGSVRYWKDANGNGIPEFNSVKAPSGDTEEWSDADEDGRPEFQRTVSRLPSPRQVSLWDENGDGRYERRETVLFAQPGQQVRVIIEEDPDGDGSYTVTSDALVPETQN